MGAPKNSGILLPDNLGINKQIQINRTVLEKTDNSKIDRNERSIDLSGKQSIQYLDKSGNNNNDAAQLI